MDQQLLLSSDKSKLEIDIIHQFLQSSYWANTRTKEEVRETINNSDCFGLYLDNKQIGFARVLTDKVAFAYLMDVFVLAEHRGNGYSKRLLDEVMNRDEYAKVGFWMLKTGDAHGLYEKYGFQKVQEVEKYMIKK